MFWIFCAFLVAAEAAKLENAYLPPKGAQDAGGSDGSLQVPLEPPYIDPYSPQPHQQKPQKWRPGTRSVINRGKPVKPTADEQVLQNEDEIVVPTPLLGQGRFISGSYSYTGPNNVLVTVTYTADNRKNSEEDTANDEAEESSDEDTNVDDKDEDDQINSTRAALENEESNGESEDGVIPTPPSLPVELARAFDFHRRKQEREEKTHKPSKTDKTNKKPLLGGHKTKGTYAGHQRPEEQGHGNFGMKINPSKGSHQGGYHYSSPPNSYVVPTIHQGYSYPKNN